MLLLAFIANTLFLANAVVSPDGRTEVVAEIIVSKEPRYVEHKFEQLEAAMMRAGICHPLQVSIAFLPSAIVFIIIAYSCLPRPSCERKLQRRVKEVFKVFESCFLANRQQK